MPKEVTYAFKNAKLSAMCIAGVTAEAKAVAAQVRNELQTISSCVETLYNKTRRASDGDSMNAADDANAAIDRIVQLMGVLSGDKP
jgi:hypothetical protein